MISLDLRVLFVRDLFEYSVNPIVIEFMHPMSMHIFDV